MNSIISSLSFVSITYLENTMCIDGLVDTPNQSL